MVAQQASAALPSTHSRATGVDGTVPLLTGIDATPSRLGAGTQTCRYSRHAESLRRLGNHARLRGLRVQLLSLFAHLLPFLLLPLTQTFHHPLVLP